MFTHLPTLIQTWHVKVDRPAQAALRTTEAAKVLYRASEQQVHVHWFGERMAFKVQARA